jgi:3-oxoacyl-[acyl-carrier protein] reductase
MRKVAMGLGGTARPVHSDRVVTGQQRTAIVTGGASGIGRATALLLADRGVQVAVLDVSAPEPVDVADEQAVGAAVARARDTLGPVSIVVNCAGLPAGGRLDGDGYLQSWSRSLDVNLTGAMHVVRACISDLMASGAGRIVNVASTEAVTAGRDTGPYTVAKHGLLGFTRALAVDYGRHGITANCVCPGATLTGMTERIPESDRETFARRHIPAGRYARPEEIAFMVVALTDPAASYVNGAVIAVDGGLTAQGR